MPEFLYLFRNSTTAPAPSPEAMQRSMQKWIAWIDQLSRAGKFKGGDPLEDGG